MKVRWKKYQFRFRFDAGTSRGILKNKDSYFIVIDDGAGKYGIGECSLLQGLSIDDNPDFENILQQVCSDIEQEKDLENMGFSSFHYFLDDRIHNDWPAIRMGLETAFLDLKNGGQRIVFNNDFIHGESIPINGLIWMGDKQDMMNQVREKLDAGFSCIKTKIGAIDFPSELEVLKYVRKHFGEQEITLRVDANGAFTEKNVMPVLNQLEKLRVHSIEQPIQPGQWEVMRRLCRETPVPIGLDEELIGSFTNDEKQEMLDGIQPQYLILKPSLLGGFHMTNEWIGLARSRDIGWWITSALESNIGLNAICQFTYGLKVTREQGLGTGQLYTNNIASPLRIQRGNIRYFKDDTWDLSIFDL